MLLYLSCAAAYAGSWGPIGRLVPSKIQPLETCPAGMAVAVTMNFLVSFILGEALVPLELTGQPDVTLAGQHRLFRVSPVT
jgi:hypothetical protein